MASLSWLMNLNFAGSERAAAGASSFFQFTGQSKFYGTIMNTANNLINIQRVRHKRKSRILIKRRINNVFTIPDITGAIEVDINYKFKGLQWYFGDDDTPILAEGTMEVTYDKKKKKRVVRKPYKAVSPVYGSYIKVVSSDDILPKFTRFREAGRIDRKKQKKLSRILERFM